MSWSTGARTPDLRDRIARSEARDRARGKCRDCGQPVVWVTCVRDDLSTYKRPLHPTPHVDGEWHVQAGSSALTASKEPLPHRDPGKYVDHRDLCPGPAA